MSKYENPSTVKVGDILWVVVRVVDHEACTALFALCQVLYVRKNSADVILMGGDQTVIVVSHKSLWKLVS